MVAVDCDDAEMWLEGAVQSVWSIADMRNTRWQTLGGKEELRPREEEIVASVGALRSSNRSASVLNHPAPELP